MFLGNQEHLSKLHAIVTYVSDVAATGVFLKNHFGLEAPVDQPGTYLSGDPPLFISSTRVTVTEPVDLHLHFVDQNQTM